MRSRPERPVWRGRPDTDLYFVGDAAGAEAGACQRQLLNVLAISTMRPLPAYYVAPPS